jgi:hypothetical protein
MSKELYEAMAVLDAEPDQEALARLSRPYVPECPRCLFDYAATPKYPEDVRVGAAEYLIARALYGQTCTRRH